MENNLPSVEGIPSWIIKYDEANYRSSAGAAVRELLKIVAQRDKEIEKWKDAFTSVNAQLKELRQEHNNWLQRESQYIDDKEKEIDGLKERCISWASTVDNLDRSYNKLASERDHYKALAEAAELALIDILESSFPQSIAQNALRTLKSIKIQTP